MNRGRREREREKEHQKLRNKDEKTGVNVKIKGDKKRELETCANKESRLLTRRAMWNETSALQRERQLQIMREYQTERTNSE